MTWQALHSTEDGVLRYKSEANIVLGHVVGKEYCFPIMHGDRLVASPGLLIPLGREISFEYNPLFRCARRTSPLCSGSYVCVSNYAANRTQICSDIFTFPLGSEMSLGIGKAKLRLWT